ncbi:MAG: hypothetical protein HC875_34160 [Anaerolineales bacterium]|nr:hypothetical protein [Anaerolineales bacterium]
MSITYSLHKNPLTTAPEGSFRAVVHFKDTVNTDKLIDRMMEREPGITREVAEAAVKLYFNTIYAYVLDGHRVVTPFGVVGVSIKGNFTRQTDSFDSSRHSIEPTLSPGVELRRTVHEKAQVQQQEASTPQPNPIEYHDLPSGEYDHVLRPPAGGRN